MPLTQVPSNMLADGALTLGTSVATTSGTAKDFTGIPSWAKRVTLSLAGVSTNGTASLLVQIGTGGSPTTTGYNSTSNNINNSNGTGGANSTSGLVVNQSSSATSVTSGAIVLTSLGGNVWSASHAVKNSLTQVSIGAGDVTLSGTLDNLRLTTTNGTDTFDAGSANILYE